MADFATVDDFVLDFGDITGHSRDRVAHALHVATVWLREQLDCEPPYTSDYMELLAVVTVSLAKRYLDARDGNGGPTMGGAPLTQFTQTAGSYSVSGSTLNPGNALWLTSQERDALGIGGSSVFCVPVGGGGCCGA